LTVKRQVTDDEKNKIIKRVKALIANELPEPGASNFSELKDVPGIQNNKFFGSDSKGKLVWKDAPLGKGNEPYYSGGGATNFLKLHDTPSSYTGQELKIARVNATGTGLEFVTASGEADTLQSVTDRGATTTTSITANSYLSGSWLNVTEDLFRQNTNLTGAVVLRDVSDDLFGFGDNLKGYTNMYINDTTPDILTGILMGDLSPFGADGDTMIVGVNDFSDLGDQVQASTTYNGDITGSVVSVFNNSKTCRRNIISNKCNTCRLWCFE